MGMKLHRQTTVALMIDMQEKLMPAMEHRQGITNRTLFLLNALKELGIPVFVSQQYTKGLGNTEEQFARTGAFLQSRVFDKITYSCCQDPTIVSAILEEKRMNVLVWGVEAHICVQQTVLDLLEQGFCVYLIADCTDSRTETDRSIAFRRMEQAGAVITTAESVVYELLEKAGTEEFKKISRLVKDSAPFEKNS